MALAYENSLLDSRRVSEYKGISQPRDGVDGSAVPEMPEVAVSFARTSGTLGMRVSV